MDIYGEEAEFTMPHNYLKEKAGDGGIPQHLIESAQTFIRDNTIEYAPYASDHITEIEQSLKELKNENDSKKQKEWMQKIIQHIMHIKAHGGMFDYDIMSDIASKTLTFLEDVEQINEDLFDIIEAHNVSIKLIINHNNKGNGGTEGKALDDEMKRVIGRYTKKYNN